MNFTDLFHVVRRRWLTITAIAALGVMGGLIYFLVTPARYTATATLYVAATAVDSPSNAYQGAQLSQQRVSSYVTLATSTRISRQVVQDLALGGSPDDLASQLSATAPTESVVLTYSANSDSPQMAVAIINDAANVLAGTVDEIERPVSSASIQAVSLRVVEPAAIAYKTSTGLRNSLAFGLLAGIVLGLAAALARETLDTRVRDEASIRGVSSLPMLASLPVVRANPESVMLKDAHSHEAESYRRLRTNLQFVALDRPNKVIAITSPMPADGKTTCVLNLAAALAASGASVLVVDGDLRRPTIAHTLGVESEVGLSTLLIDRVDAGRATQHFTAGGFDVIASGALPPNPNEMLGSAQMAQFTARARQSYDYVLVDTPPLLPVADTTAVAASCDGVVLVCRHGKTTKKQLQESINSLFAVEANCLGIVLNMNSSHGKRDGYSTYYGYSPTATLSNGTRKPASSENAEPRTAYRQ